MRAGKPVPGTPQLRKGRLQYPGAGHTPCPGPGPRKFPWPCCWGESSRPPSLSPRPHASSWAAVAAALEWGFIPARAPRARWAGDPGKAGSAAAGAEIPAPGKELRRGQLRSSWWWDLREMPQDVPCRGRCARGSAASAADATVPWRRVPPPPPCGCHCCWRGVWPT